LESEAAIHREIVNDRLKLMYHRQERYRERNTLHWAGSAVGRRAMSRQVKAVRPAVFMQLDFLSTQFSVARIYA